MDVSVKQLRAAEIPAKQTYDAVLKQKKQTETENVKDK